MSDNEDKSKIPQSTAFGAIGLLANNPLAANPNEAEPSPNEITTNIIKDASRVASAKSHQENINSDNEDIQRKMNGIITDLQSESITPDDKNFIPRKSITSGHLTNDQENSSTPAIIDSSSNDIIQGPPRSMSESALIDHHDGTEQPSVLPVQQDESSTEGDDLYGIQAIPATINADNKDSVNQLQQESSSQEQENNTNDDFFDSKTKTTDDYQRPLSSTKQNDLDGTVRADTTPTSRIQSATSKKSQSPSDDGKRVQLPDETGTDTDRDNQEVANISRRPSLTKSPVNRPRTPTPDDSRKNSTNIESQRPQSPFVGEQAQSPKRLTSPQTTKDDTDILVINQSTPLNNQEEEQKPSSAISSASKRESTNKTDQQKTSRPSSALKSKSDDDFFQSPTDEQSNLIKPGEQFQIPTNDIDNERTNNSSPLPSLVKSMVLTNPLLESSPVNTDQEHSQPPDETNRKSPTPSSISNEKIIDGDVVSSKSRPTSNTSQQQQTTVTDQKSNLPSSRKGSTASQQQQTTVTDQKSNLPSSRKGSAASQQQQTTVTDQKPNLPSSRKGSTASQQQTTITDQKPNLPSSRKGSTASQQQQTTVTDQKSNLPSSRKGSTASQQQTTITDQKSNLPSSRKGSTVSQQQQTTISDQKPNLPSSRKGSNTSGQQVLSKRGSVANEQNSSDQQEQKSASSSRHGSATKQEQIIPDNDKKDSRRSSTNIDVPLRTSAKQKQERILSDDKRQSPLQKRSAQETNKNSNVTTDETVVTPILRDSTKNAKRSSITDSDNEQLNTSKLPRVNSSSQAKTSTEDNQTKEVHTPPIQSRDNKSPSPRPQTPTVEQMAQHNQTSETNIKKKEQHRLLNRSNSAESSNYIRLVDDKSLDSTSGNNTEPEQQKRRRVKSKKKDAETSTDSKNNARNTSTNGNYQQQQQESTPQKPLKPTKPMSDHVQPTRRRASTKPDTEPDSNIHVVKRSIKQSKDSNDDQDPLNVNVTVIVKNVTNEDDNTNSSKPTKQKSQDKQQLNKTSIDTERHTQSDTEQILTEKQKKRRRPKRISRTSQTYDRDFRRAERLFRRVEREEHKELRPTTDSDKNIQTRKSQLRSRTKSPRKNYPTYLSADEFKIQEISSKQSLQVQQKPSLTARSMSPQNGKLLILRPTLPFHHTDAVNVQRISLQYSIDLIPKENKSNKPSSLKQSEQTNNLPIIHSSTTANVPTTKPNTNKTENRTYQRKNGGTV